MSEPDERITCKDAMFIGAIGGAFAGVASYAFPENIFFNGPLLFGFIIRIAGCAFCGLLYGYLRKLPDERWAAFERGMIAPLVFSTLLFNYTPDKGRLDKIFDSSSFVSVAYAKSIPKSGVKGAPIIRRIIKGILGK